LKNELESLHPSWKMIGAVVPLVAPGETAPSPSSVLRRANQACAGIRQQAGLELGGLDAIVPAALPPDTLPLASLYLRCQKIQPCTGGAPAHYEILLGLDDSLTPLHSTQSFVEMAEQTGHIHELDAWVLGSVLDWMERNASMVAQLSGLSINLSGACLTQQEHIDAMAGLFSAHPELARKLILEVTETSAIDNLDAAARAARAEEAGLPHRARRFRQRLQLLRLHPAAAARLSQDRRHLHPQHPDRQDRPGADGVDGRRRPRARHQGDRGIRRQRSHVHVAEGSGRRLRAGLLGARAATARHPRPALVVCFRNKVTG
jgi:2-oxo-4-hydroxy-4-carboxy--5-ureidoimidazoline (OHCU) decarboxylase